MITGVVPTGDESIIPVTVHHPGGGTRHLPAVIDTGFTGALSLPPSVIAALGLGWSGSESAILADGSVRAFAYYDATVEWDDGARAIVVLAADYALVGMALLAGCELTIHVVPGGRVTIAVLP